MKDETSDKMSLTETAYKYIFDGILNGRYRAGQSLSPDSIVKSLNMSKTPVREALVQLEVEGLVFRNGRYYNVIFLDEHEVLELYEIRGILESEATYLAATRGSKEFIEDLQETLNMIKKLNEAEHPEPIDLANLNGKFHSIIAAASGNRYIAEYTSAIRLKLKVIRTALFSSSDRRLSEIEEHESVLTAILEGNPAAARDKMRGHVEEVIEYLRSNVLNRIY